MTTAKQNDYLNRLSTISSTPSNSFAYLYNAANQRTMDYLWDGSYWRYGYDALGQVNAGNKFWVDQTPVAGQQFDYTFDTIGNRTQTEAGGDQNGANLRVANYTNNALNQITSRSVPGYVDVMGDGLATNGVTVNSSTAYQKNEYFREQLSAANTSAAVWDSVTVAATGQSSVTGHIFVPQTPEIYTYDPDGNLLSDGRFNYSWDGENRLTNMTSLSTAPSGSQLQLAFAYDYMGWRIQKTVSTKYSGTYIGEYTNNYAYDGWNCLALLNSSFSLLNSFWLSKDPLGEQGFQNLRNSRLFMLRQTINRLSGYNLYCLLNNQPISVLDVLGLGALAPCGAGQKLVPMQYYEYRKSSIELSVTDLIPWREVSEILETVMSIYDKAETLKDLYGEEYSTPRENDGCVPQCFVQTCKIAKVTNLRWDTEPTVFGGTATGIEIICYWVVETDYSYGLPGFIPSQCVNQNAPPNIPIQ
jgi:hypothetical protein